jgi:hypothetical protein
LCKTIREVKEGKELFLDYREGDHLTDKEEEDE